MQNQCSVCGPDSRDYLNGDLLLSWGVAQSRNVEGFQSYFGQYISIESGCSSDTTRIKN
jgi:hypothetical protein